MEVIVRRVLDPRQVELWFPGNEEALAVNRALKEQLRAQGPGEHRDERPERKAAPSALALALAEEDEAVAEGFAGDDFTRSTSYTPPRTVTLDTRLVVRRSCGCHPPAGYFEHQITRSAP